MVLETKKPREQSGRDSFGRFRAQCRSAAIAALSILEDRAIDRVYCDLHDDFVIRKQDKNGLGYIFFQVKTNSKQNHNWTLSEILGINSRIKDPKKQSNDKIKNSFIGKLLLNTVVFDSNCNNVIFQTNINNSDDVERLIDDIENGVFANKFSKLLVSKFNDLYSDNIKSPLVEGEIKERISKLQFQTDIQYLKVGDDNFIPMAREKIHQYSEIDLGHTESNEILSKLLELVENKSEGVIKDWTSENIEKKAGISVKDLLSILSISSEAYEILSSGGDAKAIKNASIIQRTLSSSGANEEIIKFCSQCKTDWDEWVRNNRHIIQDLDFYTIQSKLKGVIANVIESDGVIEFKKLRIPIKEFITDLESEDISYGINEKLALGGLFSEIVREKS